MLSRSVAVPIETPEGAVAGHLHLSLLPSRQTAAGLFDFRADPDRETSVEPIQLVEGFEYRYRIQASPYSTFSTDRPEIFEGDDSTGAAGRVRPGQFTGRLPIGIFSNSERIGSVSIEVRSRKLDYLREYRWMLRDLADAAAEVIMRSFGPAVQGFETAADGDARTAYQRFAFLQSLFLSETFQAAIAKVLHRPYTTWIDEREDRDSSRGLKADSTVARAVVRPGPRRTHRHATTAIEPSWRALIPQTVQARRATDTFDSYPNRFIKFALTRWRDECAAIHDLIREHGDTAVAARGMSETAAVVGILESLLSHELFAGLTPLTALSVESPVLLRKEGYRELYRAFLEAELAARLAWRGGEDVYGAGQRNLAALYEYWVFGEIAKLLANMCDGSFDLSRLFVIDNDGLNLILKRGHEIVVDGHLNRLGRRIRVSLWFNRTFSKGTVEGSSWTRQMRPDCSLRLAHKGSDLSPDETWLHFDAKYRAENLLELFGGEEVLESDETSDGATAKREDLLKMHAYRDAIHRSSGAYVIYPGESQESLTKYHELLPGLGAFGLRPSESGVASGARSLGKFLDNVIDHFASQVTQHERGRFWEAKAYSGEVVSRPHVPAASFLDKPPADVPVLLAYVKSPRHWQWILTNKLYNLRADQGRTGSVGPTSAELSANIVIFYNLDGGRIELGGIDGPPRIHKREELLAMEYPNPAGETYFCLPINLINDSGWEELFSSIDVERARHDANPSAVIGEPVVVSWLKLTQVWAARIARGRKPK